MQRLISGAHGSVAGALLAVVLSLAGCTTGAHVAGRTDPTTVDNESGASRWGGVARHVEELSIGVDIGEAPYLLSRIMALWATEDRIFVLHSGPAEIRVFDREGRYVRTIGRSGQGPGEFQEPLDLVVAADGKIHVLDSGPRAILVLSPEGDEIDRWSLDRGAFLVNAPQRLQLTNDAGIWGPTPANYYPAPRRVAGRLVIGTGVSDDLLLKRYGEGGILQERPVPLPDYEPEDFDGSRQPFTPRAALWALSPTGDLITGLPSEYRFEIHRPDGSVTVVTRNAPAKSLDREHFSWAVASTNHFRQMRGESTTWDPPPVDHYPFYRMLLTDRTGRIWVIREGGTEAVEDCDPNPLNVALDESPRPCFETILNADVFDADGVFLGTVDPLFGARWRGAVAYPAWPRFLDGNTALFREEDEAGTIMVKRYRLVLPGEEGH